MREEIRRHESAVAVTADANAVAVRNAHLNHLVDRSLGAGDELLDVGVIRRLAGSHDRHGRVVKDRVSLGQQKQVGYTSNLNEAIR